MGPRPRGQHRYTSTSQIHHRYLWQLLTVLVVLWPIQVLAQSQAEFARYPQMSLLYQDTLPHVWPLPKPVPSRPPLPSQPEIAALLEKTLPQFDIDPHRLPERFRRQVCKRIYNYTVRYRKDVQQMLQRADTYLPMIKRVLQQQGLPTYFAYLPLVESAFQVKAMHPKSGARGLWQFMARTARAYGLQVSKQRDERLDPQRATRAAVRYLQTLQERFGLEAPLHILAAYNFGENNVSKLLRREQTQDIWPLFVHRRLPYQTREYLIKMVTLWVIVAHPERFQLALEDAALTSTSAKMTVPMEIAQDFTWPGE